MNIEDVNPQQYVDLFGGEDIQKQQGSNFGSEVVDVDILSEKKDQSSLKDETQQAQNQDGLKSVDTEGKKEDQEGIKDVDLLGTTTPDQTKGTVGRKPKNDFSDISGYFEDRLKAGKFVPIEQETEDGQKQYFIPKTPEEFDEVIDIQVDYKVQQIQSQIEQGWYKTKSPAWQVVAQYAEIVDDPKELIPFLQGVQNIQSVANIDHSTQEGAEAIVRYRLQLRGETEDLINDQIESLKASDKLLSTAEKYKPMLVQEEEQKLSQIEDQKKQENLYYEQMIHTIRNNAIQSIEAPLFGKKLRNEEKAVIYDLIGEPSPQTGGYQIYNAIDHLFESGDFETLRQIALLVSKRDSYMYYISEGASKKTAASLQSKLRVATDRNTSRDNSMEEERIQMNPNQFSGKAKFGR
jgi:hypothetical protein